ADSGGAVVLITHKLDEVFAAADRVTVLRRGRVTLTGKVAAESPASLAEAMLGSALPRTSRVPAVPGDVLVRGESLLIGGPPQSFAMRSGEVVGIAAIEGNGQRELLRAIAGVVPARGTLEVATPVAFVPEDRTREALIPAFTLTENLLLGVLDRAGAWIDWTAWRARTKQLLEEFDVRADGPETLAAQLSGGNQQKLIFARAFERAPRVLVAEDPTRGLDILATQAIHERLRAAAAQGMAVVMYSSDLDEVLAIADRVLVIANGVIRELPVDASREVVGQALLGVGQ
ncbi:MAG: ATP-binding cassette domain-containing protein, partial [Gemmatimonadales bacterium]